jgi:hypothetical protein
MDIEMIVIIIPLREERSVHVDVDADVNERGAINNFKPIVDAC